MKLRKRYIVLIAILTFLIILAATHVLWLEAIASFLIVQDELYPVDVIIVLGGGGAERVLQAVKLYKEGYADKIVFTGMKAKLPGMIVTWPQLAMREASSLGIPESKIILEERPTSTYEDAVYSKEDMIKRGLKSAIIVSSPHHTRRARMIFHKVFKDNKDMSIIFSPVESDQGFQVHRWWTREAELIGVFNEYCKLVFYIFKYII
ncbi:hypothetical protein GF312_06590 [Candidatus Poribacteria bacterium]|nr:hypothetical protein [Candidatus Poribacteria bacterium]